MNEGGGGGERERRRRIMELKLEEQALLQVQLEDWLREPVLEPEPERARARARVRARVLWEQESVLAQLEDWLQDEREWVRASERVPERTLELVLALAQALALARARAQGLVLLEGERERARARERELARELALLRALVWKARVLEARAQVRALFKVEGEFFLSTLSEEEEEFCFETFEFFLLILSSEEEEEEEFCFGTKEFFFRKQLTDLDLGTDPITITIPEEAAIRLPPGDERVIVFYIDGRAWSFEIRRRNGQRFLYCDRWQGFVSEVNLRRGETLVFYRMNNCRLLGRDQQNVCMLAIES